jgi:hypothetical protein
MVVARTVQVFASTAVIAGEPNPSQRRFRAASRLVMLQHRGRDAAGCILPTLD